MILSYFLFQFFSLIEVKGASWNFLESKPESCGKVQIHFGTSYGGIQSRRGEFPWNVALVQSNSNALFCGGSLLSKKLVVTAAHCIEGKEKINDFKPKDIFVIIGAHDLEARREHGTVTETVKEIYVHHDWNPYTTSYDADIAILELGHDVAFSNYIQPICLTTPGSEEAAINLGVVAGFGKSEYRDVENIARKIPTPIHTYEFCVNSSDFESLVTRRTFCGGYANKTAVCVGDSGSGLIVNYNGINYLRGIVSSSISDPIIGCNITSYSVFTDILEFYNWITSGKDEKILVKELLEENRKLKSENEKLQEEVAKLLYEIEQLKLFTTTTQKPIAMRPRNKNPDTRISSIKCKEYEQATQKVSLLPGLPGFPKRKIYTDKCLHKSIALIVGGVEAKKHEFPHQALLGYEKYHQISWLAGGSLISVNYVLTAASAIQDSQRTQVKYVKLGMNSRSQSDSKVSIYEVSEIIRHPSYTRRRFNNDIALLKLNETVQFTEFLYPACLPTIQPENEKAVVTGFGKTDRYDDFSEILMKAFVEKYSHVDCQNILKNIRIEGNSMICYGNKTHQGGSCRGDLGGPLQVGNDEEVKCTYKLIGIVSFGSKDCGTPGVPDIYTSVFYYLDWIEEIVWKDEI